MGPAQDTYDGQAVKFRSMFLGINAVDCLLCHDGAHHLDQVNLWGSKQTRQNMWGLSAYFARTRMQRLGRHAGPDSAKFIVSDLAAGDYHLNTTTGNRSARQPINGCQRSWNPAIRSTRPASAARCRTETRRRSLARADHGGHSVLARDRELHLGKVHGGGVRLAVESVSISRVWIRTIRRPPMDASADESRLL